ncbi:hypothetical protein [Colwellia echini]|uniref:TonB C-terminal domain-containing protein n=1 Tax=Colwellia echini TaxID=1982103 RepID=A0ABY3MSM0_9GAMM|nr:hypothetical protein [Colwellia echini]TYK64121.1 hypothetical protein CWS31_017370 [Colwellia echini]
MRLLFLSIFLLFFAGCKTIEKETNTTTLINLPAKSTIIKLLPIRTKGINYNEEVWVDFSAELGYEGMLIKVKNVKLVDSSHPESKELIKKSLKALNQWSFNNSKFKGDTDKRYLIRVSGNRL